MIVFSLLAGLLPHVFTFFNGMLDRKQELAILNLQLAMSQANLNMQLQEINIQSQLADKTVMYNNIKTNVPFVDGLNGAVRPMIAIIYTIRMIMSITHPDMVNLLDHDYHIYSAIIAFYFGGLVKYK